MAEFVGNGEQLQKTGHAYEIGVTELDDVEYAPAEFVAVIVVISRNHGCGKLSLAGTFQSEGVGRVRNHLDDACGKPGIGYSVNQILQRAPAAAQEHREPDRIHADCLTRLAKVRTASVVDESVNSDTRQNDNARHHGGSANVEFPRLRRRCCCWRRSWNLNGRCRSRGTE